MLPKHKRLNLKTDFKWVAFGKRFETSFVTIFVRNGENTLARIGIANSSKVFNKAHDRNRARRVTSASLEALYSKLPDNINIVALPKTTILKVKSVDVLISLEETLRNEKIIN